MSDPRAAQVRVVFILGVGRSGSTLLDTILGSHPEVIGVGEMGHLAREVMGEGICACGFLARHCAFWKQVEERWRSEASLPDLAAYAALEARYRRLRDLPHLLRQRRWPSRAFRRYAAATEALFRAIREVSGRPIVVDSSKNRVRAMALTLMPGLDLRLVHLVRDGRGVAWSRRKPQQAAPGIAEDPGHQPPWRTATAWTWINLQSEWVSRRVPEGRRLRIRYEDYLSDPRAALARLGELIGCDYSGVAAALLAGQGLAVGHLIAGNPLRMQRTLHLRPDEEWKEHLSPRDQRVFRGLAGWMLRRYGYD